MTWKLATAACAATFLVLGCNKDTPRTLAGGEQIDALHRVETFKVQTEQKAAGRFKEGLDAGGHTRDLDAAAQQ